MFATPTKSETTAPTPILRWVFQRDVETLTCRIDVADTNRFEVCVVPHWDVSQAVIERFDAPMSALSRHAEIARRLRESGWMVMDRSADAVAA
jgi:hypothetical protein